VRDAYLGATGFPCTVEERELGYEAVLVAFHNAKGDLRTISRLKKEEPQEFLDDLAREPMERIPEVAH